MDHQSELEKTKYRNWVRGGLAYKYLKGGIESFVDEIVQQEHSRILSDIKHAHGQTCSHCSINTLKPLHKSEKHPATVGKDICPKGQTNCNCLFRKKQKCPNKVCDAVFEEILNSHGSTPPAPNWKNTNIQNWCSMPWEIAKCFINAPGYSDKVSASDTDISGLLHVLINNINLHEHFSVNIDGNDVFSKAIEGRNTISHSPAMELEDYEVNKYIDNIIAILEDEKELKSKEDSKQAVVKLKQLKDRSFTITTHDEVEVCRDAMTSINSRSEELKQMINDAKDDIAAKQTNVLKAFDDKSEKALADALSKLDQRSESQLQMMKQTIELLKERIRQVELDSNEMKERLTKIEQNVDRLDAARNIHLTHLEYVQQKLVFQRKLIILYEQHYVKTWISPFKVQDTDVNINEVYVTPNMIVKEKIDEKPKTSGRKENNSATQVQDLSTGMESNPIRSKQNTENMTIINTTRSRKNKENIRAINKYQDIFQTNGISHKKIYIIGDIGTGKSSLGKMMILNWCTSCKTLKDEDEDVEQMRKFDFLFFIPLQRMSGLSYDIKDMIETLYKDFGSKELIERIAEQDGERCLIIADGLDEWTPPKTISLPQHVSLGIPNGDGMRNATFINLSRSSAKGILNMKSTEFDQKIKLLGLKRDSITEFTRKYLSKHNENDDSFLNEFMKKIRKSNLQHLERTPFLLQQLICMHCNGDAIGQSVSDIYSNILNIIFHWCESKEEERDSEDEINKTPEEFKRMRLPKILLRLPTCKTNERLIFLLSKLSFVSLTDEIIRSTFGRSKLLSLGMKKADIETFLKLGILVKYNGFDPTCEKTYFSFVHISYLEFFAAIYISSHCTERKNLDKTILEKLFMKFESAVDILQFSNLLKMVCGLSPFLTGEISKLVSMNVRKDKGMINYRKNLHDQYAEFYSKRQSGQRASEIQNLMNSFLSECGPDGPTEISLCDIIIQKYETALIRNYTPDNVISLTIDMEALPTENDILKDIAQFSQLEFLCVYDTGRSSTFSYNSRKTTIKKDFSKTLEYLLAQINVNVKNLSLIYEHILQPHAFNLSKYSQLLSIHLRNVWCILGSEVSNLKSFHFSTGSGSHICHQVMEQISLSLTQALKQAVSLRHLTLKNKSRDCKFNDIFDLSNFSQLQSIRLDCFLCTFGSDVKNLETVYISGSYITEKQITHEFCEQLSSSLGKAVSLKQLYLESIKCNDADCEGHTIDLSGLVHLQSIHLNDYFCTFGPDVKNVETVYISGSYITEKQITHEFCEQLSSSLGKAVSLKQLYLYRMQCKGVACEGHIIDLSGHVQLQSIEFIDSAFILNNAQAAQNLETVKISGKCSINKQFITHEFCEQLLSFAGKAISLKRLYLNGINCKSALCEGHTIDLSGHVQLECIEFVNCAFILKNRARGANNLKIFVHFDREFSREDHAPKRLLFESLSEAVAVKHLTLKYFGYFKGLLDLSKYDQLQSIQFEGDFSISGLSTKSLEKVAVNRFSDVENLIYLCSGSNVKMLEISGQLTTSHNIFGYQLFTSGTNSGIQHLEQLESLKVTKLHIDDENALTVSPIMQNINNITFCDVKMSPQAWLKFVDSLRTLKQTVNVSCSQLLFSGSSIVC